MTTEIIPTIVCDQPDDVAEVTALDGFRLHVRFNDGTEGQVYMSDLVHSSSAGVFAQLADAAQFSQAYVQCGAVTWPGELDLAPDTMYAELKSHGEWKLADPQSCRPNKGEPLNMEPLLPDDPEFVKLLTTQSEQFAEIDRQLTVEMSKPAADLRALIEDALVKKLDVVAALLLKSVTRLEHVDRFVDNMTEFVDKVLPLLGRELVGGLRGADYKSGAVFDWYADLLRQRGFTPIGSVPVDRLTERLSYWNGEAHKRVRANAEAAASSEDIPPTQLIN